MKLAELLRLSPEKLVVKVLLSMAMPLTRAFAKTRCYVVTWILCILQDMMKKTIDFITTLF